MSGPRPVGRPPVSPSAVQTSASVQVTVPPELVEVIAARAAAIVVAELGGAGREPWIGVVEAAAHLACGKSRVYALVSAGRIPHRKDGSRVLFRRSELDAWLDGGGGVRP